MIVVFDTNVIFSGLYFGGRPLLCLEAAARGLCHPAKSAEILFEYEKILPKPPRGARLKPNITQWLAWFALESISATPADLGEVSSRDVKDHRFRACAVAVRADFLVSGDVDLLSVKNPFDFQIVAPADFLKRISS